MSKLIDVGDLVRVERWGHPHGPTELDMKPGMFFVVEAIHPRSICCACRVELGPVAQAGMVGTRPVIVPLPWLRRIPPLSELESTEHKEEQPA